MRYVNVQNLQPGMLLAKDIVSTNRALMLKRGIPLNEPTIKRLEEQGYAGAYIADIFSEDIEYSEAISDELFTKGLDAVKEENIGSIVNVAASIVSEVSGRKDMTLDLFDLRSTDEYTFHHSVNVAVFSVVVGQKMGLYEDDLRLLSQAAICHDLGKIKIEDSILNKNGRLTDEEYEQIKKHPEYSNEILKNNPEVSAVVRQAVLCHHENENGSGYPRGLEGKQIPILSKIIHVVDVYDALTNKRPYKEPYAPVDALDYLAGGKGVLFDEKVVEAALQVIPAFPPGIDVLLSNGERALVVRNSKVAQRPVVKLHKSGCIIDLSTNPEYERIKIIESDIMPPDYLGDIEVLNEDRGVAKAKKDVIMVVDDAKASQLTIAKALEEIGEVVAFSSGLDAIKYLAEKNSVDLILMDIEMPILDGINTIAKMKKMGLISDAPFIFMTGSTDKETVVKCKVLGAVDYILKPVNVAYMKERVKIALKKSHE